MLEQNVYQADLTARGIFRLLHVKHERHFFTFRNPSLLILLLLPQVVASNLQIHDRTKYYSFGHSCSNGGPTSTA